MIGEDGGRGRGGDVKRQVWIAPKPSVDGLCTEDGCGKPLGWWGRYFCSKACDHAWKIRHDWAALRLHVFKRDHMTCVLCGFVATSARYLQADHVVPIADGGAEFDPANVRTLCIPCHKLVTRAWHVERAVRRHGARVPQGVLL